MLVLSLSVAFVNVYILGNKNLHLLSHHNKKMTNIHYCTECLGKRRQGKEMQNIYMYIQRSVRLEMFCGLEHPQL